MPKARMIINPVPWAKKAWSDLPALTAILEKGGITVDLTFTKPDEPLTEAVKECAARGYDMVIVGGGDGTVSEVARGLVGTGVPLGILPFGTYNNIAHSLNLPFDVLEAAKVVAAGVSLDIDVGVVGDEVFFEAMGAGLDASLFPIGEEIKEGHYQRVLEGALTFLRHSRAEMVLVVDGKEIELQAPMVVVANGPYYGAGFTVAPQACLSDGLLDVVTFECSWLEVARHFALSAQNREHIEPCVNTFRGREIQIIPRSALPAHADGRPIGAAPLTCQVKAGSLRVIVPAATKARAEAGLPQIGHT
jgi:diacylglycerol kinase (ATP)